VTETTWYVGHCLPIVPAPDDRCRWLWSSWWNEDWQGESKYSEKTCSSAVLSTTNPTWPDLGSNPGRRGKPATNRLSYGMAWQVKHRATSYSECDYYIIYIHVICVYDFFSDTVSTSECVTLNSTVVWLVKNKFIQYGWKWSWPNLKYYPSNWPTETTQTSVKTRSLPAKMWSGYL
jgi:hypothetical protein